LFRTALFRDLEHMVYEAFGEFCAEPQEFIELAIGCSYRFCFGCEALKAASR